MDNNIDSSGTDDGQSDWSDFTDADWAFHLIEQIPDMACLCHNGMISHVNTAGLEMLGLKSVKRLQGRPFSEFLHPDYRDIVDDLLVRKFVERGPFSVKFQRGKHTSIDAEIIVSPIGNTDSGLVTVLARDITDKIRITESLLRSENRYRQLVEKALNLICICEDGYITYINSAGSRTLHEKNHSKMIGRQLKSIVHPDYRDILTDGLAALAEELENPSGSGSSLPIKLVCVDGDVIDVELAVISFGGPGEDIFMLEAHDITRRLQATRTIREREQRLNGIMNSVADAIITTDDTGIILSYNPAAERIFGHTAADVVGKNINLIIPGTHKERHNQYYRAYLKTGQKSIIGSIGRELEALKADGTIFPVELSVTELRLDGRRFFTGIIHDITKRKQAENELRRAHDELEIRVKERTSELTQEIIERKTAEKSLMLAAEVIANLTEAVVIVDKNFKVSSVNPAFSEISGYGAGKIINKRPPFYKALKKDRNQFERMNTELAAKGYWEGEIWTTRQNGQRYAIRLSISAIISEGGKDLQHAIVFNDITKRKQDEERIYFQANYDPLTELPNRTLFQDRLHQGLFTMARADRKLGLMFLDLDGFKEVNDNHGHDIGDLLLQEAAKRLQNCIREGDTVARLGGDEFTVIMPNLVDPTDARLLAQRILETISAPYHLKGQESVISASIGVTIYPDDASEASDLVKNADVAMYRAKEKGKANFQFFTADLNEKIQERLILKNGLVKALENGEFELHYQPKMNIQTGQITGVEALMRWNNETLGNVSPVKFIPVLEETGSIVEVGEWALRTACQQHKLWIAEGLPPIRVAVNLSARQLREETFVANVEKIMKETGATPQSLEIEITESMVMSDATNAVAALMELNELGLHIAMDDFGTGYSSLSYLKNFPIHTIKIDRSFVSDIATSNDDTALIRTIIQYSHNTGRKVVAEGVENEEQLSILKSHGCDEIQGYFFSKPMPADQLTGFLKDKKFTVKAT